MSKIISMQDMRTSLASIARQAEQGETFVVVRNSKPVFRIDPIDTHPSHERGRESGRNMTLREIHERFDAQPVRDDELTAKDLDRIIHEVHRKNAST